ncbi:hypothetical protein [Streptomyces olivaceoviridis]|uniref:hypothetical protein n=1 Tax=Streptomyces olivaceoviridis TaxID=1921 RepID=UPI0036F7D12A
MAIIHPTEEERQALCEWLTANGIDYNNVPLDSMFAVIDEPDGQRLIHYNEFVRDEQTRNILADPRERLAVRRMASAPCKVEPPAWLGVPGTRG